jgi:hypothetical protein
VRDENLFGNHLPGLFVNKVSHRRGPAPVVGSTYDLLSDAAHALVELFE